MLAQVKPITFEELEIAEPRPVLVMIMTNWCKYCHAMKNNIVKNKEVSDLINNTYHLLFLDAEERSDIVFKGKVFKYRPSGSNTGIHELALDLGMIRVQISYPTLTILDEKKNIIFQKNAYLKPKELLYLLNVSKMIYLVMRTGICTL
jgi:thioredoxin-related protein